MGVEATTKYRGSPSSHGMEVVLHRSLEVDQVVVGSWIVLMMRVRHDVVVGSWVIGIVVLRMGRVDGLSFRTLRLRSVREIARLLRLVVVL